MSASYEILVNTGVPGNWHRVWKAWSKIDRKMIACSVVVGLVATAITLLGTLDVQKEAASWNLYAELFLSPQLGTALLLLCYLAADAIEGSTIKRNTRLLAAVVLSCMLDQTLTPLLLNDALGLPNLSDIALRMRSASHPQPSPVLCWFAELIFSAVFSGLIVLFVEAWRAQDYARRQFACAEQTRAGLVRRVLQSRLAAMQAQVEPQFLFETLVEIARLYEADSVAAAALLDRLIAFLRVALPGLRESGSSLAAEAELVAAYLCVMQARAHQVAPVSIDLPSDAHGLAVSPMLLLPLVQQFFRRTDAGNFPLGVSIRARSESNKWNIFVSVEGHASVDSEEVVRSVRDRLLGLYGDHATLAHSTDNGVFEYRFCIPTQQKTV